MKGHLSLHNKSRWQNADSKNDSAKVRDSELKNFSTSEPQWVKPAEVLSILKELRRFRTSEIQRF